MGREYHDKLLIIPYMYGGIEKNNQNLLAKKINQFLFSLVHR